MTRDPRIDAYLASLQDEQRVALQRLRDQIARAAPEAVETISYGMPAFKLDGRFLVSFAGWRSHSSIYPLTSDFLAAHEDELERYGRTKGSLHFTTEQPLSDALVDDLVRRRVADLRAGGR